MKTGRNRQKERKRKPKKKERNVKRKEEEERNENFSCNTNKLINWKAKKKYDFNETKEMWIEKKNEIKIEQNKKQ